MQTHTLGRNMLPFTQVKWKDMSTDIRSLFLLGVVAGSLWKREQVVNWGYPFRCHIRAVYSCCRVKKRRCEEFQIFKNNLFCLTTSQASGNWSARGGRQPASVVLLDLYPVPYLPTLVQWQLGKE